MKEIAVSKPRPTYKKNDVFFHKIEKRFFIIDSTEWSKGPKGEGFLYSLRSPNIKESEGTKPDYKRCYEKDIPTKYIPVDSAESEMVKILYGN